MLPSTRSGFPSTAACKLIASSGAPVAKATTVSPITTGETLHATPNLSTDLKNNSAPPIRITNPTINNITVILYVFLKDFFRAQN
jgi:hypothetical protein